MKRHSVQPVRVQRRTLLKGAGIALALPLLDAMQNSRGGLFGVARAATTAPLRVMSFHFPHGVVPQRWFPSTTGTAWEMTEGLTPLADFRADINVLSGLDQDTGYGTQHAHGMPAFGSGLRANREGASGPSFDQVLADEFGAETKFRCLVANNMPPGDADEGETTAHMNNISWTSTGAPAPSETDVRAFYMRLVADLPDVGAPPAAEVESVLLHKQSVLDYTIDELEQLKLRVGTTDRARLDEHLTSLREVERLLTTGGVTALGSGCEAPAAPGTGELPLTERAQAFLSLFAMAFACDQTRYASFALSNGYNQGKYPEILGESETSHHSVTHSGGFAEDIWAAFPVHFAKIFAHLLGELKNRSEGDTTLLHNCLIYYGSEMSVGGHQFNNMPVVLAGHACGQLETGRYIAYPNGTPLAHVFRNILQIAGSSITDFSGGNELLPDL